LSLFVFSESLLNKPLDLRANGSKSRFLLFGFEGCFVSVSSFISGNSGTIGVVVVSLFLLDSLKRSSSSSSSNREDLGFWFGAAWGFVFSSFSVFSASFSFRVETLAVLEGLAFNKSLSSSSSSSNMEIFFLF
jgi:hypothetical protein